MRVSFSISHFISILCFVVSTSLQAKPTLSFIVNSPGAPPYIYQRSLEESYSGIIPDILNSLSDDIPFDIKYVELNRTRGEFALYKGTADMSMLSRAWAKEPERLIFSKPLLVHRSFLYQTEEFPAHFSLKTIDDQTRICTRRGYTYPVLEGFFTQQKLIRVDAHNQRAMLKMLFKKRCDFAILNEYNALSLMHSSEFNGHKLFASPHSINEVELNIAFRAELTKERDMINHIITKLQTSQKLEGIIKHHVKHAFQ